ncbi:hypothetical protein CYMTET_12667 [Cymbomonas tetramitiformis]|uniref:Uncharacterized protein n=1 Tax=Cymbomonas tetramitiformis TaxID=36881 RepID=A0AAE0LBY4_9CHLO|nr:hypothetical protein CYMTET_12667 [Cymbomonas tetramitiformis]
MAKAAGVTTGEVVVTGTRYGSLLVDSVTRFSPFVAQGVSASTFEALLRTDVRSIFTSPTFNKYDYMYTSGISYSTAIVEYYPLPPPPSPPPPPCPPLPYPHPHLRALRHPQVLPQARRHPHTRLPPPGMDYYPPSALLSTLTSSSPPRPPPPSPPPPG